MVWPSIALLIGSLIAVALFRPVRSSALRVLGEGTQDAVVPPDQYRGGDRVRRRGHPYRRLRAVCGPDAGPGLPPLVSSFVSVSLVSGITGSTTGGLQIFADHGAELPGGGRLQPEVLHRLSTMAAGGFDSLPHCGAVVAMLTITGLTHKEAYRDVGIITVVIPVIAAVVACIVAVCSTDPRARVRAKRLSVVSYPSWRCGRPYFIRIRIVFILGSKNMALIKGFKALL